MECVLCDPPLARATAESVYRGLDEALQCDIVTLHVPLTAEGPDATLGLIGDGEIRQMRPGSILVNAARGGVVDESALCRAIDGGHIGAAIVDVWHNEPDFNPATLQRAWLGTPHIAGHSLDGKLRGTDMMVRAVERFLGIRSDWPAETALKQQESPAEISVSGLDDALDHCLYTLYDPRTDDKLMREWTQLDPQERQHAFSHHRRNYPIRREFAALKVNTEDRELAERLSWLGLQVANAVS